VTDKPVHICFGGPMRKILVNGKPFLFEDHHYCGPLPCRADGSERKLGNKSPFWDAVTRWYQSGKKIGADGFCELRPKETK
jgi:hypothetical protein